MLNRSHINLNISYENVENIMLCIKNIDLSIQNLISQIGAIDTDDIWKCDSSLMMKNLMINKLSLYRNECNDINILVKQLVDNLSNYENVDKKIISTLNGIIDEI